MFRGVSWSSSPGIPRRKHWWRHSSTMARSRFVKPRFSRTQRKADMAAGMVPAGIWSICGMGMP
jgi:hypothetical protein